MTTVTNKVLYVGLSVDDKSFHGAGLCNETDEVFEFKCKPTMGDLLNKLRNLEEKGFELQVCYEATYRGLGLHRDLDKEGIECIVIPSSLIPELANDRVKTGRLDSLKLATYFAKDFLNTIHAPDSEDEDDLDFTCTRSFLNHQRSSLEKHILSTCRDYGIDYKSASIDYKSASKGKSCWTQMHIDWLLTQLKNLGPIAQENMELLLDQYDNLNQMMTQYNDEIEQERDKQKKVLPTSQELR